MNPLTTREVLERFGRAFDEHDPTLLDGLIVEALGYVKG